MSTRPEHRSTGADSRILIVADDLTGGNACGALFAEAGLRTITVAGWSTEETVDLSALLDDYDAVVVNADSRHLPATRAAELTDALIRSVGHVDLVACRIDSTLRGSIGAVAEAALGARRSLTAHTRTVPTRVMGLCVPAFPAADRTTVHGQQLLHGRLLEHTELRRDVRSPMRTSRIEEVLREDTELDCRLISISTVLEGREAIRAAVLSAIAAGADVIVADALTTDHVELVGSVVATLTRQIADDPFHTSGQDIRTEANLARGEVLDWVTIDPGPGSLALTLALLPTRPAGVIFGVSGSATEVTRSQLAALAEDPTVTVVRAVLDEEGLPDVEATLERIAAVTSAKAIILATVVDACDLRALSSAQAEETTRRLAAIAEVVMRSPTISGLYTTGGDVTAAVMNRLGAVGMEIEKEIIPLAVGGRLVGGRADGLPIVTKGGLIGDSDAAAACLSHLVAASRVGRG